MLQLEEARERILASMPPATPERIALDEAHGRILAEEIVCPLDLPAFDNSAMDGYAVRAEDVRGASAASPISLRLAARVAAGETFSGEVVSGACVRVFTGSSMPRGADAVVMQEDTSVDSSKPDNISFLDAVKPWENVRFRGEDVKAGAKLAKPGDELVAGRLQLLAAAGLTEVSVGRRPVAGLLATGSELIDAGQPLAPGKIHESNRLGLAALATRVGAVPRIFPLVPDTLAGTREALETAFQECDIVVTSGGVSVGEMDFVKKAFQDMGGTLEFWRVAIRPGKPFVFGRCGKKFLFGLPGNPVSAFVTFLVFVRPALARWQGATDAMLPVHHGILAESFFNPGDRRHLVRVVVDASGKIHSAGPQASHIMTALAEANGLLDVPAKTTWEAGCMAQVMRWS